MKHNNFSDEQLEELLNKLPEVEDHQTPDELFKKISSRINEPEKSEKAPRRPWVFPTIATAAIVGVLLIISPSLLFNNTNQDTSMDEITESNNESLDSESNNFSITSDHNEKTDSRDGLPEENSATEESGHGIAGIAMAPESLTAQEIPSNAEQVSFYLPDSQSQYLIPITFLFPKEVATLEEHLNKLSQYVPEEQWGVEDYIYENVKVELNASQQRVILDFQKDLESIGSTGEHMFVQSLSETFALYGYQEVVFKTNGEPGINLSNYGYLEKLEIKRSEKSAYKIFQKEGKPEQLPGPTFLVPIPQEGTSDIEAALEAMQYSEEAFNVKRSIPEQIAIDNIEKNNNGTLGVTFAVSTDLINTQEMVNMIDAILLTAKSYGYQNVKFESADIQNIGPYNLTRPVEVPVATNVMQPSLERPLTQE